MVLTLVSFFVLSLISIITLVLFYFFHVNNEAIIKIYIDTNEYYDLYQSIEKDLHKQNILNNENYYSYYFDQITIRNFNLKNIEHFSKKITLKFINQKINEDDYFFYLSAYIFLYNYYYYLENNQIQEFYY